MRQNQLTVSASEKSIRKLLAMFEIMSKLLDIYNSLSSILLFHEHRREEFHQFFCNLARMEK